MAVVEDAGSADSIDMEARLGELALSGNLRIFPRMRMGARRGPRPSELRRACRILARPYSAEFRILLAAGYNCARHVIGEPVPHMHSQPSPIGPAAAIPAHRTHAPVSLYLILVCLVGSTGGFLFGFDT